MELKGHTAIDLFAGAGGFSLAACNLGVDVVAAIELDADACETYKKNMCKQSNQSTKIFNKDILKLSPQALREELHLPKGELDLLMGGPPCQGFSSHRIKDKGVDDPRNRLLIRYFDFVKEFQPKIFLVENVPGLLWKRHELYLHKFIKLSRDNKYTLLGPTKINAKDYGIPQNRNRVFILGIRGDITPSNIQWPPSPTHFASGKNTPEWTTASSVFEQAPPQVITKLAEIIGEEKAKSLDFSRELLSLNKDPSVLHMQHTAPLVERFAMTPINGGRRDIDFRLPCHAKDYGGHVDVYGRIRLAQPGPTITTGCFNPSKGRFLHPWKNHGITIRHAARFQTFPDDFVFAGGITSQGKQVGNAVPVKLGEVMIAESFKCLHMQTKLIQKSA